MTMTTARDMFWTRIIADNTNSPFKKLRFSNLTDAHFEWIAKSSPILPLTGDEYGYDPSPCASKNFEYLYLPHKLKVLGITTVKHFVDNYHKQDLAFSLADADEHNFDYDHSIVKPYEWPRVRKITRARNMRKKKF